MRRAAIHRSLVAWAAASVAVLAVPLCTSATATANPPPAPAAATTMFQVPLQFLAGCRSNLFMCWSPPPLTTVTPTATPYALGVVTFAAEPPTYTWSGMFRCLEVTVNWRNLTSGAAGTTALLPIAPQGRCRNAPATAVTGSGTIVATADIGADPRVDLYQIQITPGLGTFQVH